MKRQDQENSVARGYISRKMERGFGFISLQYDDRDLFWHSNELRDIRYDDLREGDQVYFEITGGPETPVAVNISISEPVFEITDGPRYPVAVNVSASDRIWEAEKETPETNESRLRITKIIEEFRELTPDLVEHLRQHEDDLRNLKAEVFEHLVGELLFHQGWDEVRLVGRNSETSADIYAGHNTPTAGVASRYFVEVKRRSKRIGVEILSQVLGAMVSERDRLGWHAAIIVTLGGASDTRKFSAHEWRMKGLFVKDKEDLMSWLRNYKPNSDGLWLAANTADSLPRAEDQ